MALTLLAPFRQAGHRLRSTQRDRDPIQWDRIAVWILRFEHDLVRKPDSSFRDHAPVPPACGGTIGDRMPLSFAPTDKGILPDRLIAALAEAGGVRTPRTFEGDQSHGGGL